MSFLTKLPRSRYRMDAFKSFDADQVDFNANTLRAMAWMSQLAYESDEPAKIDDIASDWGMTVADDGIISEDVRTIIPKASTQAIACRRGTSLIFAFAGTDPVVLANWITNFDINITDVGSARGFTIAADAVWPRIESLIKKTPATTPILVTGHSLGGALAVLTAQRIEAMRPGSVRAVYTFGMPRAGSPEFAKSYNG